MSTQVKDITYQRICKLLSTTYAIDEKILWNKFLEIASLDKILAMIESGELR